jgi:hypothetical protein
VDAQVATANSIPWSSTAKFSRNGVLVAPLRVTRYSEQARGRRYGPHGNGKKFLLGNAVHGIHLGEKSALLTYTVRDPETALSLWPSFAFHRAAPLGR